MNKPNPGWQQLQRERFNLSADYRFSPPNRVQPLGDLLPGVLKELGLENATRLGELTPRWTEFVGGANAKHSRPGRWENGVLTIYADHNVWLAEMKRFASKAIFKRIREAFGEESLKEIRFQIDPGDEPSSEEPTGVKR